MSSKIIHIISFDNPYPPNYGGVIDVFHKIKAFHNAGINVILHCFVKERNRIEEPLRNICKNIYVYNYKNKGSKLFSELPFSVELRNDIELLRSRIKSHEPILFEGLKTTLSVIHGYFVQNQKFLRLHNLEENYYNGIAKSESNLIKKLLFKWEAIKYKKLNIYSKFNQVLTISNSEQQELQKKGISSIYLPVFNGNENVVPLSEFGEFVFFHGDLRTSDNMRAAKFLISLFNKDADYKLVIASGSGEKEIQALIKGSKNIYFEKLKDEAHLKELFKKAHVNISWSFQNSGTKLKLINSLYNSRFCIINSNVVDDEHAVKLCHQAETGKELINTVNMLMNKAYTEEEINKKKKFLYEAFDDAKNVQQILQLMNFN